MVTFSTRSHPDIVYINEVADQLLRFMGHSGAVPSAVLAQDIPDYLINLERELAEVKDFVDQSQSQNSANDTSEPIISIHARARPLIELLTSALDHNHPVSWR